MRAIIVLIALLTLQCCASYDPLGVGQEAWVSQHRRFMFYWEEKVFHCTADGENKPPVCREAEMN